MLPPEIDARDLSPRKMAELAVEVVWFEHNRIELPYMAVLLSELLSEADPEVRREAITILLEKSQEEFQARFFKSQGRDSSVRVSLKKQDDGKLPEEKVA